MRDRVTIVFAGQEFRLLPAFSVIDGFEDRCGALTGHLIALTAGTATLKSRATLVYLAMKAAAEEDNEPTSGMSIHNTAQAMWEAGAADNDLMLKEVELIERLLYTPEQYAVKKAERERIEAAQRMMEDPSAFPDFSALLRSSLDGNPPSSGEQPPESSSPA